MAYTRALLVTQRVLVTLQVLVTRSCTAAVGVRQETTAMAREGDNWPVSLVVQWENNVLRRDTEEENVAKMKRKRKIQRNEGQDLRKRHVG